jgi:hypothetical protein
MKLNFAFALALCAVFSISVQAQHECAPVVNTSLFNGKDLSSWEFVLKDKSVDPANVFMVKDAAIHITGNPFGYMRTKLQFSEYKLHLEWRWPAEATNSGVFIHTQTPDTIWPSCFEVQLMGGNAGDFICSGSADMKERSDKAKRVIAKKTASNEVPVGEWNTMEVICKGNTIEVYINGVFQNKATETSFSKGYLCLQSEGKDIEFRNVFVSKL